MSQTMFKFPKDMKAKAKVQNRECCGVSTPNVEACSVVDPIVAHVVAQIFLGMNRGMSLDRAVQYIKESLNEKGKGLFEAYGKDYQEETK